MGTLYNAATLMQDLKKKAMIEELVKMGIIKNQAALAEKDYDDIKQQSRE